MKKVLKAIWEMVIFALGFDGEIRKNAVDAGICDFSGQGRDKYGH